MGNSNVFLSHEQERMTPNLPTLLNTTVKSSGKHKRVHLNNAHLLVKRNAATLSS